MDKPPWVWERINDIQGWIKAIRGLRLRENFLQMLKKMLKPPAHSLSMPLVKKERKNRITHPMNKPHARVFLLQGIV